MLEILISYSCNLYYIKGKDMVLSDFLYSSLFTGHQCVIKTYLTIGDKFFIQGLIHPLQSYIKGCHVCQVSRNDKLPTRQLQTRINLNYRPLSRLSMDLKVMPRSYNRYMSCIIDEVTNYLITVQYFNWDQNKHMTN